MNATLLLAEDDSSIAVPLTRALGAEGYDVIRATDGGRVMSAIEDYSPNLVVLDVGLPGIDGLEICRRLRADGNTVPVLMLTARTEEADLVVGLDAGADDYVGKPFRMSELLARVRALLRRRLGSVLSANGVLLEEGVHKVTVDGIGEVLLTPKEFDLLQFLMSTPGRVFSREEVVDVVWGDRDLLASKTVDMHVHSLRQKLGGGRDEPIDRYISTIRGAGMRFNA